MCVYVSQITLERIVDTVLRFHHPKDSHYIILDLLQGRYQNLTDKMQR